MPQDDPGRDRSGEPDTLAARISTDAVEVFLKYTGRGPAIAETTLDGETAYIVLRETLTSPEKRLLAEGHRDEVLAIRGAYQEAMRPELIELVERRLSRRVVAFASAENTSPEVAVELFVLDGRISSRA
jgi:uncharacterized protein YbcI